LLTAASPATASATARLRLSEMAMAHYSCHDYEAALLVNIQGICNVLT